jgi:hypothetical protein
MIARTVLRVLLSLALLGWFAARLAPAISADHALSFRIGLMLVVAGGLWSALRLFARRGVDARTGRASSFWAYVAPPWSQDVLGVLLIFSGAGLLAWGMS